MWGNARQRTSCSAHARSKQELLLAVHVATAHQVNMLASLHQVLLPSRVQVDDPVHGRLSLVKFAVPMVFACEDTRSCLQRVRLQRKAALSKKNPLQTIHHALLSRHEQADR